MMVLEIIVWEKNLKISEDNKNNKKNPSMQRFKYIVTGADPEFLERGFSSVKDGGLVFVSFFLNIP